MGHEIATSSLVVLVGRFSVFCWVSPIQGQDLRDHQTLFLLLNVFIERETLDKLHITQGMTDRTKSETIYR